MADYVAYEPLLNAAHKLGIYTYEKSMPLRIGGLYGDDVICINKDKNTIEKACAIAEELGHHHTSAGRILDQSVLQNRKQELRARQWAYYCLIPLDRIVQAYKARVSGRFEIAEYLGVTEEFLQAAIDRYTAKYGIFVKVDERYTVRFDPLGVIESFE